ncbi:MAG: hypothetical protein V2I62_05535 [Bacteroidales bacterium]|jgi:hypothetical protein|nr:hypothetical protein [Bacteroidales bacterium]
MHFRSFIFSIFIFISATAFSQDNNSFFSVGSGVSIPVGTYGGTTYDESCYTTTGINLNVEGAWYFLPYLGIGAQIGYNLHPVDVRALGYGRVQNDPFLLDVSTRSEAYQMITGGIGPYASWNFWKDLSLHGKVLAGMIFGKTPYQVFEPEYFLTGPRYEVKTSARDYGFIVIPGIGFQYKVSPCIGLKIDSEFYYREMIYGFKTGSGVRNDYRTTSFINVTLGLVVIL